MSPRRKVAAAAAALVLAAGGAAAIISGQPSGSSPPPCPVATAHAAQQPCAADSVTPPAGQRPPLAQALIPPTAALGFRNGYIPASALCPITGGVKGAIAGEGELLCGPTAASWNAMAVAVHAHTGTWLASNGSASAYRPYSVQVELRNYWCARGACQNAAVPGSSNHGLATAVDNPDYSLIRQYGPQFHWGIGYGTCSDAPWENWHAHYCGGFTGSDPGPFGTGGGSSHAFVALKLGSGGPRVFQLNCRLRHLNDVPGHEAYMHHHTHHFGPGMVSATRAFQQDHKLDADGVYGSATNTHMVHRFARYEKNHKAACHR